MGMGMGMGMVSTHGAAVAPHTARTATLLRGSGSLKSRCVQALSFRDGTAVATEWLTGDSLVAT
jgi:hypothetical protein